MGETSILIPKGCRFGLPKPVQSGGEESRRQGTFSSAAGSRGAGQVYALLISGATLHITIQVLQY
jgi:hypothetical protein